MNHSIRTLLYISVFGLLATGCSPSSNSSSNKPAVVNKINGYVGASNIVKATVFASPIDVQGQPSFGEDEQGNPIGAQGISNTRAYYELELNEQESARPVIFIANAQPKELTTQRCELVTGCKDGAAYANGYPLLGSDAPEAERFRLNAAVGSVGNNSRVNINWITHLAADIAYTTYVDEEGVLGTPPTDPTKDPQKPVDGMFTPYTIERGNIWIKKQFGLGDIISVRPIAPSALNESSELTDGLREQGIRYGALLAAGQQLAKDKGITDVAWVSSVIDQQRDLHGQLYLNASDTEFSMCKLYGAAESVLASNLERQMTLSAAVRVAAQEQQAKFKKEEDIACSAAPHAQTKVKVDITEIEGWVNSFKQAKLFIDDLNKRILNMRCDKGEEGFFDCGYVAETKQYYDDLEQFYHNNKPELVGALHGIRDDIDEFIACLNGEQTTNPCTATEYKKDNLTYTLVPVESTKEKVGGVDKYYAFDFRISGTKAIGANSSVEKDILITFNNTEKEEDDRKDTDYNFIRVVYQGDAVPYKTPAKLAFADANDNPPTDPSDPSDPSASDPSVGVEPLGFNINLVSISIENKDFEATYPKLKDFNLYFTAKLLGVKPFVKPLESQKAMHYNLTEVAVGLNIQGDLLGTIVEKGEGIKLKDTAEMTFSILFSDAANFYAKSLWPDSDDYFTAESGVDADEKGSFGDQLFKYLLMEDEVVLISASTNESGELINPIRQKADYLEFEVKGLGVNRFEKYKQNDQYMLRKCLISATIDDDSEKKDENKQCIQAQAVADDFNLVEDLITSDQKYFQYFAVPGYGLYTPKIEIENVTRGAVSEWDGELVAEFQQGVEKADLRIAQEFVDNTGSAAKRKPAAILKVKGNKKTDTSWEIAVSMGYDYKYLVSVLPSGDKNTQSFYFSYFVNEITDEKDKTKFSISELGSLSVMRDGTKFFGAEGEGKSANATIASRVDYEIDETSTEVCGYTNADNKGAKDDTCKAIAYLTVRGKLVGTLRKEKGLYVMRYSDGTFSILGI